MYKELFFSIFILIIIFSLEFITHKYTKESTNEIKYMLSELRDVIKSDEEHDYRTDELIEKWDEKEKRLSYYIEHNELEKVNQSIVRSKSFIESKDFSAALAEIDGLDFVLKHIEEKYSFNMKNVF